MNELFQKELVDFVVGLQSIVQGGDVKEKHNTSIKPLLKSFKNIGLAAILAGSTLFPNYSDLKADIIPKNPLMEKDSIPKNSASNGSSYVFTGDLKNLNFNNPMSVAGTYLDLADTCSAWDIIKSLDTLTISTKVHVQDNRPSNEKDDIADFSKLCELAVNYTIREYSKVAPAPRYLSTADPFSITVIPNNLEIRMYSADDCILGSYSPSSNLIKINNLYVKFAPDAKAFALFAVVAHETVHLLYQLNNPKQQLVDELTYCYDSKVNLGQQINGEELETFLKQNDDCEKETEKEAFIFQNNLFKTLFKGILEDTGASIIFNEAYVNKGRSYVNSEENPFEVHAEMFDHIKSNIDKVRDAFPVLNIAMFHIGTGSYNNIQMRYEEAKKKYLPDETPK